MHAAPEIEVLSIARFQEELRRASRFCPRPPAADPLAAVLRKIEQNPAHTQSRLLTRILAALTYQQGEFRRAEAAALDVDSLCIAVTLMDACAAGTNVRGDWVRTLEAARAAQGEGTSTPAGPHELPVNRG